MGLVLVQPYTGEEFAIKTEQIAGTECKTDVPDRPIHKGEAITDVRDLQRISDAFIAKGQYRNNLLFVIGINAGLRCSELRSLKFGHFINPDGTFKEEVTFVEKKTSKIDKETGEYIKGKIKTRTIYPNKAIWEAMLLYIGDRTINLDDWLFMSESNRSTGAPIDRRSIEKFLKETINDELGIKANASTHCLRKTCAYHAQVAFERMYPGRDSIAFLQKFLGHADISSTLSYVGITQRNIGDVTRSLNLGMQTIDSDDDSVGDYKSILRRFA